MSVDRPTSWGAQISPCETYRYALWRYWDRDRPAVAFIMLNPSTADAQRDDATIRRCIGYAKRWGYGGVEIGNLYAFRATDPAELKAAARRGVDVIGPANYAAIRNIVRLSNKRVICAWGNNAFGDAARRMLELLVDEFGVAPRALRRTKRGHPAHPLRLPAALEPRRFFRI